MSSSIGTNGRRLFLLFALALISSLMLQLNWGVVSGQSQVQLDNNTVAILPPNGYCPPNEVMMNCSFSPDCEPTCDNPQPNHYCKQNCNINRCHCELGTVRGPDGNCIPYERCPQCAAKRPCEAGYNKYGECRCQCEANQRCQRTNTTACDTCMEDDFEWECVVATPCGDCLCTADECCQLPDDTLTPTCVPLNSITTTTTTTTTSAPYSSSSTTTTSAYSSSTTTTTPTTTTTTAASGCTLQCPTGQTCYNLGGQQFCF